MKATTTDEILQQTRRSQFGYNEDLIHVFVGGSKLHGAKVQGTDDLDIYGVAVARN